MGSKIKISQMAELLTPDATARVPIIQGGINYKAPFTSAVTKEVIESVLTGEITSHTHPAQNADGTDYGRSGYTTVGSALDALLYVTPQINSFSISPTMAEIGSTVTAVTASWSFNKTMATATLTDTTIDGTTPNSHNFTGLSLTANKTYTLACSDGTNTDSATATVSFTHKRYWGPVSSPTPSDFDLLALSSEFSTSHAKSVTYDCTGGAYPCFAFIATAGNPVVTVGGLSFTDFTVTDRTIINASGYSATFKVLVFNGIQYGSNISVVFA